MPYRSHGPAKTLFLTDAELGYIAAMVDGEGSIAIVRMQRGNPRISFSLILSITNSDVQMLDWIADRIGGSISVMGRHQGRGKLVYRWYAGGESAKTVLQRVRPYMLVKRRQADLAIRFVELGRRPNCEMREAMYVEMKKLNGTLDRNPPKFGPAAWRPKLTVVEKAAS